VATPCKAIVIFDKLKEKNQSIGLKEKMHAEKLLLNLRRARFFLSLYEKFDYI